MARGARAFPRNIRRRRGSVLVRLHQAGNPVAAIFLVGGEDVGAEDFRQGLARFALDAVQRGLLIFR